MQEYIDFFNKHTFLVAAFLIVLVAIITYEIRRSVNGAKKATLTQATLLMNRDETVIVDIRSHPDYSHGHLMGAIHIAQTHLKDNLNLLGKDKNAPILVYCQMGASSAAAAKQIMDAGFTDVYVLSGGVNAWQAENMPLEK